MPNRPALYVPTLAEERARAHSQGASPFEGPEVPRPLSRRVLVRTETLRSCYRASARGASHDGAAVDQGLPALWISRSSCRQESRAAPGGRCSPSEAKGFQHVKVQDYTAGETGNLRKGVFRRVRAVVIDLESLQKREIALPPELTAFTLDSDRHRVFCHVSYLSYAKRRAKGVRCVLLDLATLDTLPDCRWPDGNGPALSVVGIETAFLGRDEVAHRGPSRDRVYV